MISFFLKNSWLTVKWLTIFLLVVLLWSQWPLRVLLLGNARLINDMGQIVFSCFWCVAFAMACVEQSHLQISLKTNKSIEQKFISRLLGFFIVFPWALFLTYSSWPLLINSWHEREKFPDSFSPGFYFIKLALFLFPVAWLIASSYSLRKTKHAQL
jgi:TRAP-type mannitol/chloroaromatic compound transport system permease small subunit